MDCIFCQMIQGSVSCHRIWEDDRHLAFLSNMPNTDGFTVVIPKRHYPSYAFHLDDAVFVDLTLAAKRVGLLLDERLPDVGRTGLVYEGFGVDHVHAKLIPMHGTKHFTSWRPILSVQKKYFAQYEGYLSTHDCEQADHAALATLAAHIRGDG